MSHFPGPCILIAEVGSNERMISEMMNTFGYWGGLASSVEDPPSVVADAIDQWFGRERTKLVDNWIAEEASRASKGSST